MTEDQHISLGNGFGFTPSMKLPETFVLPPTGKRVENAKSGASNLKNQAEAPLLLTKNSNLPFLGKGIYGKSL